MAASSLSHPHRIENGREDPHEAYAEALHRLAEAQAEALHRQADVVRLEGIRRPGPRPIEDDLLTPIEACELLNVSRATLDRLTHRQPCRRHIGRLVRYERRGLLKLVRR